MNPGVDAYMLDEKLGRHEPASAVAGEAKSRTQAERDAAELAYLRELDRLRQEAGITAGMLRDGRAKAIMANTANEIMAARFRAASRSGDGKPDGTREGLETCMKMLDAYAPDEFPANEQGQIHFARAMMESTADEIRAYLAKASEAAAGGDGGAYAVGGEGRG